MSLSLSDLVQALPADLLQEEHQLARVRRDSAALSGPCNKNEVRALAKQWNVAQKANGKNLDINEIRNEVEQKIRQEVDRLLCKAAGNEGHGKNVSGDQEPLAAGARTPGASTWVRHEGAGRARQMVDARRLRHRHPHRQRTDGWHYRSPAA